MWIKLVIFEASKYTKTNFFQGSAPDPTGELTVILRLLIGG